MKDLVGYVNAGYTIIKQGDRAVIAYSKKQVDQYVAWDYSIEANGEPSFFWGNYCGTEAGARECFNRKERR